MAKRGGLGMGLDSLISKKMDSDLAKKVEPGKDDVSRETMIPISKIEPNRDQPRRQFDEAALVELAESIKLHGVIQPLIVCKREKTYEIIAGERRWRAAMKAGLKTVPVLIRDYSEQELYEVALIENLQRENLNAIEEAVAYRKLIEEYSLTQEAVAERVSKNRTTITNSLRLLKLDDRVQEMIIEKTLSAGHARALLAIESKDAQFKAAEKMVADGMSVRDAEDYVKKLLSEKKAPLKKESKNEAAINRAYARYEEKLKQALGTKVTIAGKPGNKGKIEIAYYSLDEFERILELLGISL
ncbi:MAG: ParB/RepB/Spo0J family partition protein [Lachnospiraceae bacterium]|nr:ParB/RepB/Spo0J family partition protein [Lachnospiraceae bacterium]MCR5375583.1 ParB/RepB/Spo0J family partition protein [Lachnospiraceae bacterium]